MSIRQTCSSLAKGTGGALGTIGAAAFIIGGIAALCMAISPTAGSVDLIAHATLQDAALYSSAGGLGALFAGGALFHAGKKLEPIIRYKL